MVRKIMKHELVALFRVLLWFMLAVLLIGVLARISFELTGILNFQDSEPMTVGIFLATLFLGLIWYLSVMALYYAAVILSVVRYFKSLFTGEGYLTFSLPVTPTQLLIGKALSALIAFAACIVVIILSVLIALPISVWSSIAELNIIHWLFETLAELIGGNPLVVVEFVLIVIASLPAGLLYLYLIASIGQMFTKARIAITIGLYYGISFALTLIGTLFFIPMQMILSTASFSIIWLMIPLLIGFDFGSFFLIRYILLHKVNLVV